MAVAAPVPGKQGVGIPQVLASEESWRLGVGKEKPGREEQKKEIFFCRAKKSVASECKEWRV